MFLFSGNIDFNAPVPNSYTNPIVNTEKNINTIQKPYEPTSYKVTVIG